MDMSAGGDDILRAEFAIALEFEIDAGAWQALCFAFASISPSRNRKGKVIRKISPVFNWLPYRSEGRKAHKVPVSARTNYN